MALLIPGGMAGYLHLFISLFTCGYLLQTWVLGFLCMKFCVCSALFLLLSTPLIPKQNKCKGWWRSCVGPGQRKAVPSLSPQQDRVSKPSEKKNTQGRKSSHWTKPFSCFSLLYQFLVPGVHCSYWSPDTIFTAAEHRLHTEQQGPVLKTCWEIFSLGTLLYF